MSKNSKRKQARYNKVSRKLAKEKLEYERLILRTGLKSNMGGIERVGQYYYIKNRI